MLKLVRPSLEYKDKYIEMIDEWKKFGGAYVPCIVDYDCKRAIEELDYDNILKVVDDYSKGKIFDYDIDYFERSDFYFIFDDDNLVGVGEVRHNLKELGIKTIGHIACGIKPSMRKKGYALGAVSLMTDILKDEVDEIILCHYAENNISPKIIKKLDFSFRDSTMSIVSGKEIKCYTKKI